MRHLDAGDPLVGVDGAPRAVRAHVVLDHELHHERLLQNGAVEHLCLRSTCLPEFWQSCIVRQGHAMLHAG